MPLCFLLFCDSEVHLVKLSTQNESVKSNLSDEASKCITNLANDQ